MPRAKSVVAALTVVVLATGIGVLQHTEGAGPAASTTDDALPSRALGLSDHRRLARQREQAGEHVPGHGARSPRTAAGPLRPVSGPLRDARPLRLRVPSLGLDVPVTGVSATPGGTEGADGYDGPEGPGRAGPRAGARTGARTGASWQADGPAPGSAGTAVVSGSGLDLAGLQRGRTVEISRDDGRTAVFTVIRLSPGASGGREDRTGRPHLRLFGGETAVLARLTGQRRGR
ncbi:class F sortase [Streptomyces sp. NPDC048349]|uniref:class F sortase n=1 Tax=Streptomyces sp. NPDC048349 TaxID=3155486 RepID=UPI00342B7F75